MKLSICIQKGKEVRKAIITLTKESNAEYIFKRLFDAGWLVVESNKIACSGHIPGGPICPQALNKSRRTPCPPLFSART